MIQIAAFMMHLVKQALGSLANLREYPFSTKFALVLELVLNLANQPTLSPLFLSGTILIKNVIKGLVTTEYDM